MSQDETEKYFDDLEEYSVSEENYIKNIFSLAQDQKEFVSPYELAKKMELKAASITNMLKKLQKSDLIEYKPYQGVKLKKKGEKLALFLLRKHRLWESFLYNKLNFDWKEVHSVAEQLEHVQSSLLTNRLEEFLQFPKFDPHGDPIPNKKGKVESNQSNLISLNKIKNNEQVKLMRILEENQALYNYLEKVNLKLGQILRVNNINPFDYSMSASFENGDEIFLSQKITQVLLVKRI